MTTAALFAAEANARRVLIRLGEPIPEALWPASLASRHLVGATKTSEHALRFVDGSTAQHDPRTGVWKDA